MLRIISSILLVGAIAVTARFHGHGGPKRGDHEVYLFPFLANVSTEARQEFNAILKNSNLTIADQDTAVNAWATENNVSAAVTTFITNRDQIIASAQQNVTELVGTLVAKNTELLTIVNNKDQTASELAENVVAFAKANKQAFAVLSFAENVATAGSRHQHGRGNVGRL